MAQIEVSSGQFSRRRTRTYDAGNDLTTAVDALLELICPAGTLVPTMLSGEPGEGWKLCNGQALRKQDYPRLYAILGSAYGETSTTFNLPDLRGKMPLGATGSIPLRSAGGAAQVTLTVQQLPAHAHAVTDTGHTHAFTGTPHSHGVTDPGHQHNAARINAAQRTGGAADGGAPGMTSTATTGITINNATAGGSNASATTGITLGDTGSGQAIPILPPYIAVNWMVRT